jgi:nucleotide-binding universal stress UspA family protein
MRSIDAARHAVVVGVDDSSVSRAAVLWAAEEARLRGRPLLIVHVGGSDGWVRDHDAALTRELLLNASAQAASQREPTVIVGTLLLRGRAIESLLDVTRSAAMLVLGSEHGGRWLGRNSDSVTHRLTSNGLCNVVTVSRRPRIDTAACNQILAIWASDAARAGVLAAAAEEARLRNTGLTVAFPTPSPASSRSQTEVADHQSAAGDLARLAERYPALAVAVDQIDPTSVSAVSSALSASCLAVVGYRHSGPVTSRTADLADRVLRQATCPLLFPFDDSSGSGRTA